jgi:Predicted ATPase of the ABC class
MNIACPAKLVFLPDPLELGGNKDPVTGCPLVETRVVKAVCSISSSLALQENRVAAGAVADYVARKLSSSLSNDETHPATTGKNGFLSFRLEPLDRTTIHHHHHHNRIHHRVKNNSTPFVLDRTDIVAASKEQRTELTVFLRCVVLDGGGSTPATPDSASGTQLDANIEAAVHVLLQTILTQEDILRHIAVSVFQDRLRKQLKDRYVAFVANGSVLPRKSGASTAPMASPPAIPFEAPGDSPLLKGTVQVEMDQYCPYLVECLPALQKQPSSASAETTTVTLSGLLIPRGVSLIVGGGYHGKSTLLRCIAAGVYNKVKGDGREFCVTVDDAVTVRAEDGRYVNHCNVSAFISNLPTDSLDTKQFSSREASGSTSQAANVVEAIEMGASAMLVDEDVSAANFMARDGRMRSLVMDESITPLLYRVNGLFASCGISSIVVVGGVGDWLDVPDAVILMDKYRCKDATAKARSISKQFSHGHVQYAGRGVVHRLNWERSGTPIPRRPANGSDDCFRYQLRKTVVTILDGSDSILLEKIEDDGENRIDDMSLEPEDEGEQYMDMSRCEQLMGKKPQLYGCGLCVVWLLAAAQEFPEFGLADLLLKMDEVLDASGVLGMISAPSSTDYYKMSPTWEALVEVTGCAYRPRRFEVGQALTRLRGLRLEEIPVEDDGSEAAAKAEAEQKRKELLAIWNARRKNPLK